MMKGILTMVFSLLFLAQVHAQQKQISGVVKDNRGEPVPFANVTESGTKNTVQADAVGRFVIKISQGATLTLSASGYQVQTVEAIDGLNATMIPNGNLTEVIITTQLGQQRQAKELGYSTARVRG